AVGGIFALVYAGLRGRVGPRNDGLLAIVAAGTAFLAIVLVPFVKYPANPPAVGDPDTIDERTLLYLVMVLVGLAATAVAVGTARRAGPDPWRRWTAAVTAFLVPVVAAWLLLPPVDEVPEGFPATLLWDFRLASLGTQLVFWSALGVLFGLLTERATRRPAVAPAGKTACRAPARAPCGLPADAVCSRPPRGPPRPRSPPARRAGPPARTATAAGSHVPRAKAFDDQLSVQRRRRARRPQARAPAQRGLAPGRRGARARREGHRQVDDRARARRAAAAGRRGRRVPVRLRPGRAGSGLPGRAARARRAAGAAARRARRAAGRRL